MKTRILTILRLCWLIPALLPLGAGAQSAPPVDCNCLLKIPELRTNACQAIVPDLCRLATNCFSTAVTVGSPGYCSQTPAAGTPVGPGTTYITLTVTDNQGTMAQCVVPFVVTPASACSFTLICATNKMVECGSKWTFDPPTWINACAPPPGTVSNGVVLTVISSVTNGSCPQVITRTWQAVDDCGYHDQCSQTVTVVDTKPPQLDCNCLTNNAVMPVKLTVVGCAAVIPDLCLPARVCSSDACGVVGCAQSPAPGTAVGVGVYPITVTVYDCASNTASCVVNFTVLAPPGGCVFSLLCSSNKLVECGTAWTFDPPAWTNACSPPAGTVSNGVVLTVLSTVTNGSCPQIITRTWQGVDDCGYHDQCSQTVTVVDTTPPQLDCGCLTNSSANPVKLTVYACTSTIPDLCLSAKACATDRCGLVGCVQYPPAGTSVGVGVYPISITVYDCASNTASCVVNFTVLAPPGGCGTNPCVPPPPGMVGWWPLDEATGALTYADLSGNGNIAVVESGGPVGSGGSPSAIPGKVAGAGYFYMTTSRGRAPNVPSLNFGQGSFSLDGWVNPIYTGTVHWHPIVDKYLSTGTGTGFGYMVGLLNTKVVLRVGDGTLATYTSVGSVAYSAWNFIAVAVDRTNNTVTFHINGVTEPAQTLAPAGSFNSPVDLLIGGTYAANQPHGEIALDEIELFNRPLTTVEFIQLWQADAAGKCKSNCNTYQRVWNTGMGGANGDVPLVAGTPDPNYTLISAPAGGCTGPAQVLAPSTLPAPPWMTNGPNSQWIGAGPTAICQGGVYHYRICFDMTCTDGAAIVGQWSADDYGEVLLNGQPTGNTIPSVQYPYSFTGWHPINFTNGFVCGMNCLDFYVTNAYAVDNPTGFRAELTNIFNDCCCTATQTLFTVNSGIGAVGVLPQGAPDPQIALTCVPSGMSVSQPVVTQPSPFWMANNTNSQWIGPFAQLANAPAGVYCYTLNFTIPCPTNVPIRASLNGRWMADDTGTIYLNGVPTGNTLPNGWAFTNWQAIAISSGFVPGLNTLTFYVTNGPGSPTGFRLELTGSASCCACASNSCLVTIKCPTNIDVATCNAAGEVVNYLAPTAASTCGAVNLVCNPPSGSVFPIGTNLVTCIATDAQGNSASCTFTVTVSKATTPYTVLCPPINLSVTGCPPVMPNLSNLVTIVTNCPLTCSITITQNVAVGTVLTPGPHVVIVRTCDCQGNCRDCDVVVNAVLSPNCCTPAPAFTIFSGATSSPPGLLPGGAFDAQFKTGPPLFANPNPYVLALINWWWLPNSAASKWVGPYPTYHGAPTGVYLYTNRFFLCSTNQASLAGRWTADDTGTIWLNGSPTANVLPAGWAFTNWHPVSITTGFVPGWNELVFRVTNSMYSDTGLRTEITGRSCCNSCVSIACPGDIVTNTCAAGVVVAYNLPVATSSCANLASVVCTPPPGSVFPVGTNVVTCTAFDTLGNAATCSFNVIVKRIGQPVVIKCPPNQTLYTCGSNAIAYYKVLASGQVGPVVCLPPSGSAFPLGTNVVICTATNACGVGVSCQFLVIVKPYPLGPPTILQAGLPDNFLLPVEPSPQTPCMVAAFSGFPYWKGFDATAINTLFGHHFAGLPGNIVQAQLIARMKPGADTGSDNDGIFLGLPACSFSSFIYTASIKALPGAVPPTGGTWVASSNGPTTFTLNLNAALLAHMNSAHVLDVVIHDDTIVDYMQLKLWTCPPPFINNGVPHWSILDAPTAIAATPQPELPAFGPVGTGPAVSLSGLGDGLSSANGVDIGFGGGQALGLTTVLDMNAPEGARVVLSVPTSDGTNAPLLSFVKSCRPRCGWDVIKAKRYDDLSTGSRVSAVDTNGNLLDSFTLTPAQAEVDPPLTLYPEDGVAQFPVSLLLDGTTGEITLTFPGNVMRRLCNGLPCPRGWDGTIKGRYSEEALRKGWDGTVRCPCYDDGASRIVITPLGSPQPLLPGVLTISSTGLGELVLADEHIITMGGHTVRPDPDGPDSLATIQSTLAGDGVNWTPLADGSGVSVDLGRSASFDLGIQHSDNPDISPPDQLFRIFTNRPGPGPTYPPVPPIELRLTQGADGVDCSVDFTLLGANSITAILFKGGVPIAQGVIPGPASPPDGPLSLDRWPERLGAMAGNGTLRLMSSEPFNVQGFACDEIRLVPELPSGAPPVPFYGELQCLGNAGLDSLLYDLQRVAACAPATLSITPSPTGTVLHWSADGYRLLGAETLDGPWIDLGVTSPVQLAPNAPQRYYRLTCD